MVNPRRDVILSNLQKGVDLANVRKLVNPELKQPISYNSYKYFVQHDAALAEAWQAQRQLGIWIEPF